MIEANSIEFGQLLSNAVSRIAKQKAKTIAYVQDDLGYSIGRESGGSAIAHWCKGNIPSKLSELQMLVRLLVIANGLVDANDVQKLLDASGYLHPEALITELFPLQSMKKGAHTSYDRPNRFVTSIYYRQLVGRDSLLRKVVALLSDPTAPGFVGIDGIGGIGKTAFANEVTFLCMQRGWFDLLITVEAPRVQSGLRKESVDRFTFASIIDAIIDQLHLPEIRILTEEQKESRLRSIFRNRKILLLLDNLETADEPQSAIVNRILPLLGSSKAIATSRQRFRGDIYPVHLLGLEHNDSQELIRQVSKDKSSLPLSGISNEQLSQIITTTGGSPMAVKLVIDQLSHLPIQTVLKYLREVKPIEKDSSGDEYISLYRHIYFPSWSLLSESARKLLVAMSHFVSSEGGTMEAMRAISNLYNVELYVDEIWKLSLLEVKYQLTEPAYFLHALTDHFVRSDIISLNR